MVNAYSLLASILDGTFEKDYPVMDKSKGRWNDDLETLIINPIESDEYDIIHPHEDDGLDYETHYYGDTMATIDDQRSHHFNYYGTEKMDYEPQRNHQYKYHEQEILKDIEEYVSRTYQGHYTGTKHEFRKVQTIDLMAARDIAAQFCQANILKYGSRYGSKDGRNKKDLLKVIHYAMLLLHFDGHYGEPSFPSDDFNQMP